MTSFLPPVVLVADAQEASRASLAALLGKDYQVHGAASGSEALAWVESHATDLVLADVALPDMNGFEVCRRIKAKADIPVLYLAERCTEQDKIAGFQAGGADFIFKPCSTPLVLARVKNLLDLKLGREEIQELSYQDETVDLPNRKRMDETLANEWHRAARYKRHLSFILIDVDHLAAYNEHFGKSEGDLCLLQIAQALRFTLFRPTDLLSRYDDDSFACLLPETDGRGAALIAERFRAAVENLALPHPKSPTTIVTVSVGVEARVPTYDRGAESIVLSTHQCLQKAKKAGRNRVFGPEESS